jgi:hypothetical protein
MMQHEAKTCKKLFASQKEAKIMLNGFHFACKQEKKI